MSDDPLEHWRPRAGEWDRAAAQHLHRRAGFGATEEELERALATGPEAALEHLLEDRTPAELQASIRPLLAAGSLERLQAWWLALILDGGAPLRERATLVWHDHFATSHDKVGDVRLMHAQNELLRAGALGDFRALLRGVARDPAMLRWLDGDTNRVGSPNENFAREVMELFALGHGHYGEDDVRAAARAFSGWGTAGRAFVFRPEHHDAGEKTLLGRTGRLDGDDALEIVLEHPACARHVARVLLEAFVAPAVRAEWVDALAAVLRRVDWDVGRALRVLLGSRLFYSAAARRARIAGPVELLAVSTRALGLELAPARAARLAADMGQALFRPPSVKGWDGGRAWIHSASWIARHNALVALAGGDGGAEEALERWLPGPPTEWGARVLERLLPEADDALRETLRDPPASRAAAVALVLTAPEYQLF